MGETQSGIPVEIDINQDTESDHNEGPEEVRAGRVNQEVQEAELQEPESNQPEEIQGTDVIGSNAELGPEELEQPEEPDDEFPNIKSVDSEGSSSSGYTPVLTLTEDEEELNNPIPEFTKSPAENSAFKEREEMWPFSSPITTASTKADRVDASFDAFEPSEHHQNDSSFVDAEFSIPLEDPNISGLERDMFEEEYEPVPVPVRREPIEVGNGGFVSSTSKRNAMPRRNNGDQLIKHLNGRSEILSDKDEEKITPALKRRLRDFSFAQQKRRETYGEKYPWGIIGLYDHLTGIRTDIEWAEDAAWRREHNEPYLSWSDFEGAKDTGFNQPFFTYIVMLVCTICLILSIGENGWKVEPLSVNPMIGPSAETLIIVGAKQTSLIVQEKEWWRLVTPMVLHAGIIHFVLNMLAMWFIGYAVEMNHGFMAIAILFIVPAIGGTLLSALFLPEYISVGASGGIFGLIGGCIADIVTNWNLLFSKEVHISNDGQRFRNVKVLVWLLVDILLNVLIGLTPFVDNFTHLGGMVYGFLCGLSKLERLSKAFFGVQKGLMSKVQNWLVRFFGILLSLCFIIITLVVLIRSDGTRTPCKGCRYVSCVPFPFWAEYADKWWYCDDCDLVTADAKQNTRTNFYSSMNMTCPDGEVAFIDLAPDTISDKAFLTKQLPKYCRSNCQNLFQG